MIRQLQINSQEGKKKKKKKKRELQIDYQVGQRRRGLFEWGRESDLYVQGQTAFDMEEKVLRITITKSIYFLSHSHFC